MNNYPQYPYSYPVYDEAYYEKIRRRRMENKDLFRRSNVLGLGMIVFLVVELVITLAVRNIKGFLVLYTDNLAFQYCIEGALIMISLLSAYLVGRLILNRKKTFFVPAGIPKNKKIAVEMIFIGIAACLVGSYLTTFLNAIFESVFDVEFTQPELPAPTGPLEVVLYFVRMSVVAAVFEELALRGGALQAMRKYGDWFAILTSSFVFAILHGNMIQIPFAFLAGIAIGYAFIVTGSIWPGIIIHFVNNFAASAIGYAVDRGMSETRAGLIFMVYEVIMVAVGIVCLVLYIKDKDRPRLLKDTSSLTKGEKALRFFVNAPMIISIIYMCYSTYFTVVSNGNT